MTIIFLFSSPSKKVLIVRYCDLSVVQHGCKRGSHGQKIGFEMQFPKVSRKKPKAHSFHIW